MSPREPRRTTKKRGSDMRSLANGFQKIACGMIFWIADNGNSNAETFGRSSLWNRLRRVVGTFGVNVRAKVFEQTLDGRFAEDDDVIDGVESRHEEGASIFVEDRTAGAFQSADDRVRVDADDENVTFAAGTFEITDMADVQCIKAAVGENDALSALFVLRQFAAEPFARNDLGFSAAHKLGSAPAGLVSNGSKKLIARDCGRATLHDHETAGDVGDMRGFERRSAASKRKRVRGKDRVPCTGDVDGLIASVNRYMRFAVSGFEERHAMAPP